MVDYEGVLGKLIFSGLLIKKWDADDTDALQIKTDF